MNPNRSLPRVSLLFRFFVCCLVIFLGLGTFTFLMKQVAAISFVPGSGSQALIVNSNDDTDDGTCDATHCSLREAVNLANAVSGHDQIHFTIGGEETILLSGQQLPTVTDRLTIVGDPAALTRVDAANQSRIFSITPTVAVTLSNLMLANGMRPNFFHADLGGAVLNNGGVLKVYDSTFIDNFTYNGGGAIATWAGDTYVFGSRFMGNFGTSGGAIIQFAGGKHSYLQIQSSTFFNNEADLTFGGGGALFISEQVTAVISNTTVVSNVAEAGGGILNDGQLSLNNSTIARNVANKGGGLYFWGHIMMANSIVAGNMGPTGPDCDDFGGTGTLDSQGYNLTSTSCYLTGAGDLEGTDPMFGEFGHHGGRTATLALRPNSPAIDSGNPALPGSVPFSCETTDQRDRPRPFAVNSALARCDRGALEFSELGITKSAPTHAAVGSHITYTISISNPSMLTLTNIVVTDVVPAGTIYVAGGSFASGIVSWTIPLLTPQVAAVVEFSVVLKATATNEHYGAVSDEGFFGIGTEPITTYVRQELFLPIVIPAP